MVRRKRHRRTDHLRSRSRTPEEVESSRFQKHLQSNSSFACKKHETNPTTKKDSPKLSTQCLPLTAQHAPSAAPSRLSNASASLPQQQRQQQHHKPSSTSSSLIKSNINTNKPARSPQTAARKRSSASNPTTPSQDSTPSPTAT